MQELEESGLSRPIAGARRLWPWLRQQVGKPPDRDVRSSAEQASAFDVHWTYADGVVCVIAAGLLLRLLCAAFIPLAGDEVLYWRYSRHLAAGYLDHPLMNPLLIRAGTSLHGDSPFGVRSLVIALAIPSSWAVWRAGELLLASPRAGATAALMFNLMLVLSVGGMFATSDQSLLAASAFLLYTLAQLSTTGRGVWWLGVGAAIGLGLLSKYTAIFFAPGILGWLMLVPVQRKWLATPWPYAGALLAAAMFSPVLVWNAEHGWASAIYQSSRMIVRAWSLRYAAELVGSQILMITPPIFVLAAIGLFIGLRDRAARDTWAVLIAAMITPALVYFLWHSLHDRVQANWLEFIYPAIGLAAAAGSSAALQKRSSAAWRSWSMRLAAPVGIAFAVLVLAQAAFGVFPVSRKDPTSRVLGYGWPALAHDIDSVRENVGASSILTTDYSLASELSYYLPSPVPVEQISDRVRWANEPAPNPSLFTGPMLYVCKNACGQEPKLPQRFRHIQFLTTFPRLRNGVIIDHYSVYRVSDPIGPALDPMYPIRLKGAGDDRL